MTRLTKTARIARDRLQRLVHAEDMEADDFAELRARIPDAWATLEADLDVEGPKDKVTLYLDRAVARHFRAMGTGYQARINRILETWLRAKQGEVMEARVTLEREARRQREARQAGGLPDDLADAEWRLAVEQIEWEGYLKWKGTFGEE